jgi:ABC-type branched-subunit amino acid transport system ATPase component/branched-subunit amino acid ABC-type transport system permease component
MSAFLEFAILGLALGAMYGLLSLGLVLIHRGSDTLNIAQGAFAYLGAATYYFLRDDLDWPTAAACLAVLAMGLAIGVATNQLLMMRLSASPLTRLIAALGLMVFIEDVIDWRIGQNTYSVTSFLPTGPVRLPGGVVVGSDRLIILGVVVVVTVVLHFVYTKSRFGLITSAVASNVKSAMALGHSPTLVGNLNWGIGGVLGAAAGILLVPIIGLTPDSMSLLIVPALAAALVGGFSSFTYVMLAAFLIGISQSELSYYLPNVTGLAYALPFAFIIVVPFLGGKKMPQRGFSAIKLPEVGSGGVRYKVLLPVVVAAAVLTRFVAPEWQSAFTVTCIGVILATSVVVISGYAGQLSLAQLALAGMAGWITTQLSADVGLPFIAALIIGPLAAMPIGYIVGLPSLRARGVSLAIGTLGLAVVVENIILDNPSLTGGFSGTSVTSITLAGWDVIPTSYPWRYGLITLAAAALCFVITGNLRASASGRRLLAVRSNELAASSLGINVYRQKLYAFTVAAGLAGLGGVVYAYLSPYVDYSVFSALGSITLILYVVLAGIGFASGAVLAGVIYSGGLMAQVAVVVFNSTALYQAIASLLLLVAIVFNQNGFVKVNIDQAEWLKDRLGLRSQSRALAQRGAGSQGSLDERQSPAPAPEERAEESATPPRRPSVALPRSLALDVKNLQVQFGGVVAVKDVSFTVSRGEILGLVGANGAGKTTIIDAISGFVPSYAGCILARGTDRDEPSEIDGLSATDRSRFGVRRTFQTLELFEDMSLLENLVCSSESSERARYVMDLVAPRRAALAGDSLAAVERFGLSDDLRRRPGELSYGARRIAGIARAVARPFSVLLLDEPTAGVGSRDALEIGRLVRDVVDRTAACAVLVEHNLDVVVGVCDRVIVLDFGEKIAEGGALEVMDLPVVQNAYLGLARSELA